MRAPSAPRPSARSHSWRGTRAPAMSHGPVLAGALEAADPPGEPPPPGRFVVRRPEPEGSVEVAPNDYDCDLRRAGVARGDSRGLRPAPGRPRVIDQQDSRPFRQLARGPESIEAHSAKIGRAHV